MFHSNRAGICITFSWRNLSGDFLIPGTSSQLCVITLPLSPEMLRCFLVDTRWNNGSAAGPRSALVAEGIERQGKRENGKMREREMWETWRSSMSLTSNVQRRVQHRTPKCIRQNQLFAWFGERVNGSPWYNVRVKQVSLHKFLQFFETSTRWTFFRFFTITGYTSILAVWFLESN